MRLLTSRVKYLMRRIDIEAGTGKGLFSPQDNVGRNMDLEILGRLCAEAWHDDLPEADRAWAEAHREKFGRWVNASRPESIRPRANAGALQSRQGRFDKEPAPPWPMLLEAVKSAFLVLVVDFGQTVAGESGDATADPATRLDRTSLWRTLTADDTAEVDRPSALRAFQRGFRRGRRGHPSSMTRPIPPMLEAPRIWVLYLMTPDLSGPSAARNRALWDSWRQSMDPKESAALQQELRELYASAWREDVPEEDRDWAEAYRQECSNSVNGPRRDAVAESAYEAYLQSSDGLFYGEPARPWPNLRRYDTDPWRAFADRLEDAPDDESELATSEAAVAEYWDSLYREAPPWDSDPAQVHWLAAVRAARRKALADDEGGFVYWKPTFPGPSSAREAAIKNLLLGCKDPMKVESLERELRELYASGLRDPVPDEDREWVHHHRERHKKFWDVVLRDLAGKWAHAGYLKSSGGTFEEKLAPPYEIVEEAWRAFGERVRNAPAGEGELETAEAAIAAYSGCSGQPIPLCSDHWLAALRAIRAALASRKD